MICFVLGYLARHTESSCKASSAFYGSSGNSVSVSRDEVPHLQPDQDDEPG